MDGHREKSPPSPLLTDSSAKSSSPSDLLSNVSSAAETPPRSPDTVRSLNNKSPRLTSPLPPLPPEVFLSVLQFLPSSERVRACQVSKAWNAFIVGEPRFWSELTVSIEWDSAEMFQQALFRSIGNGNKKREGLKRLTLVHRGNLDRRSHKWVNPLSATEATEAIEQTFELASQASLTIGRDGRLERDSVTGKYSTLRSLHCMFAANHVDTVNLMHEIGKASGTPLFHNLEELSIYAALPLLSLKNCILSLFPSLRSLTLRFPTRTRWRVVQMTPWFWHPTSGRIPLDRPPTLEHLEKLTIEGALIESDLVLPDALPCLKYLTLRNVSWRGKGLYRLLRLARKTLKSIDLENFSFEQIPYPFPDWCQNIDIRDPELTDGYEFQEPRDETGREVEDPCPIEFRNLEFLSLTGLTLPLFADIIYHESEYDAEEWPTPVFLMPHLVEAYFSETPLEPDFLVPSDADPPLPTLGRNAPNLENLTLTSCHVSDPGVFSCFASMSAKITKLDFYDTTVSDHLLSNLPHVVPNLKSLDVRSCLDVSCQGVARLVEVVRELGDEGQFGIEEVFVDPPEYSDYDWKAFRWLDFVGVLKRGVDDWEGFGPEGEDEKRKWIREGKKDEAWEWKEAYRRREIEEAWRRRAVEEARKDEQRAAFAREQADYANRAAAGGSGSSSLVNGTTSLVQHGVTPGFAPPAPPPPPPPHPNYNVQQQIPSALPLFPPSVVPSIESTKTFEDFPMPPLSNSNQTNGTRPRIESQESKLDISCLDSVIESNGLDPALVREQQLAFEQIEQQQQRQQQQQQHYHSMSRTGGGSSGGGSWGRERSSRIPNHDEVVALALKHRDERDREWARLENDYRSTAYAVTGQPASVVPSTGSRMAGLETVRSAGGFIVETKDRQERGENVEDEPVEDDDRGEWIEDIERGEGDDEDWDDDDDDDDMLEYDEPTNDTDALHPNTLGR
ncbi:hypothetical protein JCM16303_004049 [Sporobolomyces ruberrimus]